MEIKIDINLPVETKNKLRSKSLMFYDFSTKSVIALINEYFDQRREVFIDIKRYDESLFNADKIQRKDFIQEEQFVFPTSGAKRFYKNFGKCFLFFGTLASFENSQDKFDLIFQRFIKRLVNNLVYNRAFESKKNIHNSQIKEEYQTILDRLHNLYTYKEEGNEGITSEMYYFCLCLIEQKHFINTLNNQHSFY